MKKEIFLIYSNEYSMQITNQNYSIYNQTFYKKIEDIVVYLLFNQIWIPGKLSGDGPGTELELLGASPFCPFWEGVGGPPDDEGGLLGPTFIFSLGRNLTKI